MTNNTQDSSSTTLSLALPISVRDAKLADMPAVLAIYNHEVMNSTATYDYTPQLLEEREAAFKQRIAEGFPYFVACDASRGGGRVLGFASYGLYRPRPGWRFACEHSVYVAQSARGQGIASMLLKRLLEHARMKGFHSMVGVVDAANTASVKLHEKHGFTTFGVMKQGGFKFDRWLDVAFMQALL